MVSEGPRTLPPSALAVALGLWTCRSSLCSVFRACRLLPVTSCLRVSLCLRSHVPLRRSALLPHSGNDLTAAPSPKTPFPQEVSF